MLRQETTHREFRTPLCTAPHSEIPTPSLPQEAPHHPPNPHSLPQTFTDAGGITSWFTLGERRAGVKVAHQRGPGPGTALEHRIAGAGGPDVLGRDLVSPRGRWESPGVGRRERERGVKRRGERSQTKRKTKGQSPSPENHSFQRNTLSRPTTQTLGPPWAPTSDAGRTSWRRGPHRPGKPTHFTRAQPQQAHPHPRCQLTAAQFWHGR